MNAIRKTVQMKLFRSTSKIKDESPIRAPLESDILLGRSKASWNHPGNRKFRAFVGLYLKRYMDASTRLEKTLLVNTVAERVEEAGGRFLKMDKDGFWHVVTTKEAREKVAHALRDAVSCRIKLSTIEPPLGSTVSHKPGKRRASNIAMERRRSSVAIVGGDPKSLSLGVHPFDQNMASSSELVGKIHHSEERTINFRTVDEHLQNRKYVQALKQSAARIENTEEGPPFRSKNDGLDSGEISCMSTSSVQPNIAQLNFSYNTDASTDFSMGESVSLKKWTNMVGSVMSSFSVTSDIFDDGDPALSRVIKQVNEQIDIHVAEELESSETFLSDNLAYTGQTASGTKTNARPLHTDLDLSEELSAMSLRDFRKASTGDISQPPEKMSSGKGFPLKNAEIKARAGWENEISDDFSSHGLSSQSKTSFKTNSTISASSKEMNDSKSQVTNEGEKVSFTAGDRMNRRQACLHKPPIVTFDWKDVELSNSKASSASWDLSDEAIVFPQASVSRTDEQKPPRQASSTSFRLPDDFDGIRSSYSDSEISEEFDLASSELVASRTVATSSHRISCRKKLVTLLSDVGEEEPDDDLSISKAEQSINDAFSEEDCQTVPEKIYSDYENSDAESGGGRSRTLPAFAC